MSDEEEAPLIPGVLYTTDPAGDGAITRFEVGQGEDGPVYRAETRWPEGLDVAALRSTLEQMRDRYLEMPVPRREIITSEAWAKAFQEFVEPRSTRGARISGQYVDEALRVRHFGRPQPWGGRLEVSLTPAVTGPASMVMIGVDVFAHSFSSAPTPLDETSQSIVERAVAAQHGPRRHVLHVVPRRAGKHEREDRYWHEMGLTSPRDDMRAEVALNWVKVTRASVDEALRWVMPETARHQPGTLRHSWLWRDYWRGLDIRNTSEDDRTIPPGVNRWQHAVDRSGFSRNARKGR